MFAFYNDFSCLIRFVTPNMSSGALCHYCQRDLEQITLTQLPNHQLGPSPSLAFPTWINGMFVCPKRRKLYYNSSHSTIHLSLSLYIYIYTLSLYIYIYIDVCMCVCMYIYIYSYIVSSYSLQVYHHKMTPPYVLYTQDRTTLFQSCSIVDYAARKPCVWVNHLLGAQGRGRAGWDSGAQGGSKTGSLVCMLHAASCLQTGSKHIYISLSLYIYIYIYTYICKDKPASQPASRAKAGAAERQVL